jgi:hypothetical protein
MPRPGISLPTILSPMPTPGSVLYLFQPVFSFVVVQTLMMIIASCLSSGL